MQTTDRVTVSDGLRVWSLPRLEAGTVDLETPVTPPEPGEWLLLHLDRGRSELVVPTTITVRHPRTGEAPPSLGTCQWVGACPSPAVRMAPHPLMSPVPVCRDCGREAPSPITVPVSTRGR